MRFDLTDLRLFLAIHETGTITAAARRCHITTASASERIKGMEASLGVLLLDRHHKGVKITAAGRTFLHHASTVVQQMDRMRGDLSQYSSGVRGHVRLLANTSACSEYLPTLLGSFLQQHPDISVDLEERISTDITDLIRNGMVDIGIIADSADMQGLQVFWFGPDPLVLITARENKANIPETVSLADISHMEFAGLMTGSALHEHIAAQGRQTGLQLHYRVRVRSIDAVCRMVGNGVGIAIVPLASALRHQDSLKLEIFHLQDRWAQRNLAVCVRDVEELPVYVRQLMQHILAHAPGIETKMPNIGQHRSNSKT